MIRRIVKLTFKPEHIETFKEIFEVSKNKISGSEGCHSVELLQDLNNPCIFFTYSHWDDEKYLEQYKSTAFFGETWKKTKALFNDKPEAWSVEVKNAND